MSRTVTLTGEAVHFLGQEMEGWAIEHQGVDAKGHPIRQARQRFEGGEQIAQQGDWIVTLEGGRQVILPHLPRKPKEAHVGDTDAPTAGGARHVQEAPAEAAPTAKQER